MKTRNIIGILLAFFSVAWSTAAEPENMQQVCDSVVPAALSEYKIGSACAVVVNVPDGRVLAVGEYATEGAFAPIRLTERAHVGLLIQPLVLLTVLEQGHVSLNSYVSCAPLQVSPGFTIEDAPFHYGALTCRQVIKKSSFAGTARMMTLVKPEVLVAQFARLGVEVPTAATSGMKKYLSLVRFFKQNPMNLAAAYTAIGREGRYAPLAADGETPRETVAAMKPTTAAAVLSAMESSTERKGAAGRGTAVAAAIPGYRVACKTTTLKYNEHRPHPTFTNHKEAVVDAGIVLMLSADKPQLLVLLMLKDVRSEQVTPGGGTVAAPVARRIAELGIKLLNIPPGE
ncbi:MAG: hypothetical protein IJ943_03390 [Akkermansia sp.]|nr:hypothetical protein [Akkermansia sp.]